MNIRANVNTPIDAYTRQAARWELIRDLKGGTPSMRAAGRTWAPQFSMETDKAYNDRLDQAVLFPAYGTTVDVLARKPVGRPVQIDGDDLFAEMAEDIDLEGRDLTGFASDVIADVLDYGLAHILVEMPDRAEVEAALGRTLTVADAARLQVRPYFCLVSPFDLIGWRGENVGGVELLRRVRIRDREVTDVSDWENGERDLVRVLYPDRFETWAKAAGDDSDEWLIDRTAPNTLGRIALVTVYGRRAGLLEGRPVLEDLAYLNLAHWQSSSDQRAILHIARAPFLFGRGFTEDEFAKIAVGPNYGIRTNNASAALEYVEPKGTAIAAGEADLERLRGEMAAAGLDMLIRKPGTRTATEKAIDSAEEVSKLQSIVRQVEAGIERAFRLAAGWTAADQSDASVWRAMADAEVDVQIDQSFGFSLRDADDLKVLEGARTRGDIGHVFYLEELKRRGLLDDTADVEAIVEAAQSEAPIAFGDLDDTDAEAAG